MVVRVSLLVTLVLACGTDDHGGTTPDGVVRERVALVPVSPKQDVDILYVIDDSAGVLHLQDSLRQAFRATITEIARGEVLPNIHIGVITSDLGVLAAYDAAPGAPIGSGAGSCSGAGKDGALQTNGSTLVAGTFIRNVANSDGTRAANYTGGLEAAFASIASVGSSGCGFEQPLEAMRRALDNHPANAGFLRPQATLAIIPLQDEDDCSLAHTTLAGPDTATLGPLQSFRCTRFGVVCEDGGATPDEMNTIGAKSRCRWSEDSTYLTPRTRYEELLGGLKPDPRDVLFMPIAAGATSLVVEARTPPGGGNVTPAVEHACTWDAQGSTHAADPAVRMRELSERVARGGMQDVCTADLVAPSMAIGRELHGMLGGACLTREIALPADCEVHDETLTSVRRIEPCSDTLAADCYRLVEDEACTTTHRLRVDVARSTTPTPDTMIRVRCKL